MKPNELDILNPSQTPSRTTAPADDPRPATLGVFDSQGRPVADASVGDALATGEARFEAEREYHLLDPGGSAKVVRGAHVWNALSQGWALEPPEARELRKYRENATTLDAIGSGVIGAAESLTLGTLPALVEGFGGKQALKDYKLARGASEEAATLGEVAGLVVPFLGEVGAAAKLGRGAIAATEAISVAPRAVTRIARGTGEAVAGALPEASTALGRMAHRGVRFGAEGAVEGAAYGTGQAIGEASLGDKELTAERLLAAAGGGALLGAGIGGGLGFASGVAPLVAERVGGSLEGFAERQAWKTTGATGAMTRDVGIEQVKRSGRRMLDEGLVKFESYEERAAALRKATEEAGQDIDRMIVKIDETGTRPSIAPVLEKIDEQLGHLRSGIGPDIRLAKKLERDFVDWIRERSLPGKEPTFKELHSFRSRIDDYFESARAAGNTVEQAELSKLRNAIEDQITTQADGIATRAGGQFATDYTAAKARYRDLVKAAEVAEKRAPMLDAGNRSLSLTDTIMAGSGLIASGPKGLLFAAGNKLVREHGSTAAARLADAVARTGKPPSVADVLGDPFSAGAATDHAVAEARGKIEAVDAVKKKADSIALRMASGARQAVRATAISLPTTAAKVGAYETLAADAREHRVSPERSGIKVAARIEPLVNAAPGVSRALVVKATGDLDYLAKQLPSAGSAATPAQQKAIQPSGSERASFERKARAIKEPQSAVFDMQKGQLSDDAIAAIRERRPLMLSKIQEEAEREYAELMRQGKVPDRQTRLQVEKLLGRKVDPASNPTVVRIVQQHYAKQRAAVDTPPLSAPSTPSRRAERMESPSERVARGDE